MPLTADNSHKEHSSQAAGQRPNTNAVGKYNVTFGPAWGWETGIWGLLGGENPENTMKLHSEDAR